MFLGYLLSCFVGVVDSWQVDNLGSVPQWRKLSLYRNMLNDGPKSIFRIQELGDEFSELIDVIRFDFSCPMV